MKEGLPFQQMVLEQMDIHRQKNALQLKSHTLCKNNSKCIMDLNVKCNTIKLLGKNTQEKFQDPWIFKEYVRLDTTNKRKILIGTSHVV